MTVSEAQVKNYSIGFTYPYLLYNYMDNKQLKCTVDLLVHTFPGENFNVKFNSDGSEILVYTKLTRFFTDVNRLKMNNDKLNGNSSRVVAFEECVTKLGVDTDHEENIFGPPQRINMPFKCDTKVPIKAEPQYFEAWGIEKEDQESGMLSTEQQYYMVLSVEVESIVKPRRVATVKKMKVFKTPTRS